MIAAQCERRGVMRRVSALSAPAGHGGVLARAAWSRSVLLLLFSLFAWPLCFAANAAKPTIGIIDEKAFHLEVVAGLMQVLSPYAASTVVYLHPLNFPNRSVDYGFLDLVKGFKAQLRGLPVLSLPHFDILVLVSPEYRIDYVRELIDKSRPKVVISMIHNGDADGVLLMPELHPNLHLVTLSPHVASFANARYAAAGLRNRADWMLPLVGHRPQRPCAEAELGRCLAGFAIQGKMDARRRNYTLIWDGMEQRLNASAALRRDGRFLINVVGSGDSKMLAVPERLAQRVVPHINVRFDAYYTLIHRNLGLIPTLAAEAYFDRKFSSTVITSLVTGVPMVVAKRFLKSYSFLTEDHVYVQRDGEPAMDTVLRVLQLSAKELAAYRRRLAQLREQLNQRASSTLEAIIGAAMAQADHGTLPIVNRLGATQAEPVAARALLELEDLLD